MPSTSTPTVFQLLAQLSGITGDKIALKPYDRLDAVMITDDRATVFITTHKVRETGSQTTLMRQGTRMISYTLAGIATKSDRTLWDPAFAPLVVDARWEGRTESDYEDKLIWEGMCHRPGHGRDHEQIDREITHAWNRLWTEQSQM